MNTQEPDLLGFKDPTQNSKATMAEVTRGLFSLSSSKKPPSFISSSSSSSSSSSKHIYDDVFTSRHSNKLESSELSSFGEDDYAEIFGSSKAADNGVWESSCLSIPILTIPDSQQRSGGPRGGNGGGIDYLGVFGGVGDERLGLQDGEMLFDQLKKKAKTSVSGSIPSCRSKGQKTEAIRSHVSRQSESDLIPPKRFSQSFDGMKHFKHETELPTVAASGAAHVAHVNATPGSSSPPCEVGPSQKTQTSGTPTIKEDKVLGMGGYLAKGGKHSRRTGLEPGANGQKRENDSGIQKASHLSESNSVATSHESHQVSGPSRLVKEGAKVQFDVKDDAMVASPGTTSLHEVGPSQKIQIHRTHITQEDVHFGMGINLAKKKGEHSRNASLELGTKESKDKHDACFQKASSLNDLNSSSASHDSSQAKEECNAKYDDSVDVEPSDLIGNKKRGENQEGPSHDTCQATSVAGSTNVVKNDTKIAPGFDFDVGKKQAWHSRMTSLDLGGHNSKQDTGLQRKSRFGSTYSFDASHDPFAARIQVQPSKVVPSSSLPQFFPVENQCKISENPSSKNSETSPSSLEEQLDMNSLAAISAATLQKAIEEAEMRIRSAKEFLEREGQGNTKLTFKDTLKHKVGTENNDVIGINDYREMNGYEHGPRVDSRLQTCSDRGRKSVLETSQVAAVFEGQQDFPKDEEPIEAEISESKSVDEGEKSEDGGGEWEAAKHLNQLISGVKNKLASFMTWQAEIERKEEPKETEASTKSHQQSQVEGEVEDAEISEMKETEKNQCASVFDHVKDSGENKTGLISEVIKPEENESMQNNTVVQEKADHKVDVLPDNEEPARPNFLFFTFSSERSWDRTHPEVGEKKKTQNIGDLGVENTQKEEIDVVNYDQIHCKSEEGIREGSVDNCTSQDCGKSLQDSSDGESEGTVEEAYSMAGFDKSELSCNDDRSGFSRADNPPNSRLNVECGDERSELSYQENRSLSEGCRDEGSEFTHEEDGKINEERGNDSSEYNHQENERVIEEYEDNTSEFTHEDRESRRLSEECVDEQSNFTHEEKNDTTLSKECENKPVNSCDCPETIIMRIETDDETEEYDVVEEVVHQLDNIELEEENLVREIGKSTEQMGRIYEWQETERDQSPINDSQEDALQTNEWEENKRNQSQDIDSEGTANQEAEQVGCIAIDDECEQTKNRFFSKPEEACVMDGSNSGIEENLFPFEKSERMMETTSFCSDSEMDNESTVSADQESDHMPMKTNTSSEPKEDFEYAQESGESTTEYIMEFDGIVHLDDTDGVLPSENFVLHKSDVDFNRGQKDVDGNGMESKSEGISEIQTEHLNKYEETVDVGEGASFSDYVGEKCISEAGHRRRRWFENAEKVAIADLPSTLEGDGANLDIDHEVLDESEVAGSVEIHADKIQSETSEATNATESVSALDHETKRVNTEGTLKRRRWFVHSEGEGIPESSSLFKGTVERISEINLEIVNESLPHVNAEKSKQNVEATPRRKRWFESQEKLVQNQQQRSDEDARRSEDVNQEHKDRGCAENSEEGKDNIQSKTEPVSEVHRRKKEKEKERVAVERAIREARERAFAEARERARRDAVERPKMEESQRVGSGVQERPGKAPAEATSTTEKASVEAKLRVERAAVERATAEARERALQKSLSEKGFHRTREATGRHQPKRKSSFDPKYNSSSSDMRYPNPSNKSGNETSEEAESKSAQRRKARLERQNGTTERAAKALEDKNKHDLLTQKEQVARDMVADVLDAEVKRWSTGKEGNLCALLSTLQFILGSDSGWQAISLTDLMAPTAVRKAYKKATLCVHPDKLQQRGATIQQKYICEKVFDLLKEAWSKFNPDEH